MSCEPVAFLAPGILAAMKFFKNHGFNYTCNDQILHNVFLKKINAKIMTPGHNDDIGSSPHIMNEHGFYCRSGLTNGSFEHIMK